MPRKSVKFYYFPGAAGIVVKSTHFRVGTDVVRDILRVGEIDKIEQDARLFGDYGEQPVRAAVHVGTAQYMVAGRQHVHHGHDGRHAAAVDQRVLGVIQGH